MSDPSDNGPSVGDTVANQDPANPMTGRVIPTPVGQAEPDGWIWVQWSNGLVCQEYPPDVTRLDNDRDEEIQQDDDRLAYEAFQASRPRGLTAKYSDYVSKFGSPMACYVYEAILLNGDFGDEDDSIPDWGEWVSRYGRRLLVGDSQGFVDLWTFGSVEEAKAAFDIRTEGWHDDDDDRCSNQCVCGGEVDDEGETEYTVWPGRGCE